MKSLRILALCFVALAMSSLVTPIPQPAPTNGPKGAISEYLESLASQRPHSLGSTRPPDYPSGSYGYALNKGNFLIIWSYINGIWKITLYEYILVKHICKLISYQNSFLLNNSHKLHKTNTIYIHLDNSFTFTLSICSFKTIATIYYLIQKYSDPTA